MKLTRAQVQQVASRMPFLRELSFCLSDEEWSAEDRLRLSLPSTLSQVGIRFYKQTSAATMVSVIDSFSRHESLVTFEIQFDEWFPSLVSFAPLQELPALETLTLEVCEDPTLSAKQVQELRALSQLTRLNWNFCEETLLQMLQPPHQLQWTALPAFSRSAITDVVASLLPSLCRLRTLRLALRPLSLSSLDFLAQLPALTEVDILGRDTDHLLRSLAVSLPRVMKLRLGFMKLHTEQLQALLTHFPQLHSLNLQHMQFDSLAFLEPLRATLRVLSFHGCRGDTFDVDLASLRSLQSCSLTRLVMKQSFRNRLDAALLQLLTPPSTLLPTLKKFQYTRPL